MIPEPRLSVCECQLCGWSGPESEVPHYRVGWAKEMPECPSCHQRRDRSRGEKIGKTTRYPSCISYFTVHQTCGVGHDQTESCPEKCPEIRCYRPKGRCRNHSIRKFIFFWADTKIPIISETTGKQLELIGTVKQARELLKILGKTKEAYSTHCRIQ